MGTKRAFTLERHRQRLLDELLTYTVEMIRAGAWTNGKPCAVEDCAIIAGHRAGAIEILAGLQAGKIRQKLIADDCAVLRRAIPWPFAGEPQAYFRGQFLRIEAGWPDALAQKVIRLEEISDKPEAANSWVAGVSDRGGTVRPHLNDLTPHYLYSGTTGGGKSVGLQLALYQLSAHVENRIVLVDGKFGESLKTLERLPGVVGPCAVELHEARAALSWAVAEMGRRYRENRTQDGRIIVVIDEFQELVSDSVIVNLLRQLAAQGRGARVHGLWATQHPTVDAFGAASTRRNLKGKCAYLVDDPDASRVAVGGKSPRADKLLGAGDSFLVGPGTCHRMQSAFVDGKDLDRAMAQGNGRCGQWEFDTWPELDAMDLDTSQIDGDNGHREPQWDAAELAVALASALAGEGRPAMETRGKVMGVQVGSTRGRRLVNVGRDLLMALESNGYRLQPPTSVVAA